MATEHERLEELETLAGLVEEFARDMAIPGKVTPKRAEMAAEQISGVLHHPNQLRLREVTELDGVCTECGGVGEKQMRKPHTYLGRHSSYTVTCGTCRGTGRADPQFCGGPTRWIGGWHSSHHRIPT